MTANEKLILEIDLLHPAFMIRPDLGKIRVGQSSNDEMITTEEIAFNKAGKIKSMLHMHPGWIAHPPGNIPAFEMDRITEFIQDDGNNQKSETRDLKTKELLRQEEYLFESDKLRTTTLAVMDSGLTPMLRESNYYYDENGLLVQIETRISEDSNVLSKSVIFLDREQNGLIRVKNISIANESGELESISKTTFNYDSEMRLKNSITSEIQW